MKKNHQSRVEYAIHHLKLKYMVVLVYSRTLATGKEHIYGSVPHLVPPKGQCALVADAITGLFDKSVSTLKLSNPFLLQLSI